MSKENNTILIEWAHEIMEEFPGTWVEKALAPMIESNDLEGIHNFIKHNGGQLSQQHFYNRNIEEVGDVY